MPTQILLYAAAIIFIHQTIWYVISLIIKRNDVADLAWGLGFIFVTWGVFVRTTSIQHLIISLLITIWGFRLASHIYHRLRSRPEDPRYLAWRQEWGKSFYVRSYLQVFILQGGIMFLIASSSITASLYADANLSLFSYLGIIVWIIGFACESIADKQLKNWVTNPKNKGKLLTTGLWHYSRHPNYFGEITQWWGIWLIATTTPYGLYSIISPITITTIIMFVSGVPLLENKYTGRTDWEKYKEKTSILIPWFPKK